MSIRPCERADRDEIVRIINAAAVAYAGVIPADRYHDPYMPLHELEEEIAAGVRFWGWYDEDGARARAAGAPAEGIGAVERLVGVTGIQDRGEVTLIRHAYVEPGRQRGGVGGMLLRHLVVQARQPLLVGTWADAWWAVAFYERHGFRLVTYAEKERLLRRYWRIPERQVETSVVLRLEDGRSPASGAASPTV